jgi:hypothetical protein
MSEPTVYLQPGSALNRQSPDVQWQVAENYVSNAISQSGITSGDKYYAWLRDNGQSVSRDVARSVWKEQGVADRWKSVIAQLPQGVGVPRDWYASSNSPYITGYGYKTTVTYTDAFTGATLQKDWFNDSPTKLSRRDLVSTISSQLEIGSGDYKGTVQSIVFGSIYHKAGAAW